MLPKVFDEFKGHAWSMSTRLTTALTFAVDHPNLAIISLTQATRVITFLPFLLSARDAGGHAV